MADLTDIQAASSTKIVGSDSNGLESTPVKASGTGDLGTSDIIDTAGSHTTLTVGTSAVQVKVGGSNLLNRKLLTLDNTSNAILYWAYSSGVTTTSFAGRIFKDQQASWAIGPNLSVYVIAGSAGNNVHISEAS